MILSLSAVRLALLWITSLHRATRKDRGVIHGDVRSDNLFLVPGRGLVLCDWAEAGPGSGIDDGVYWAVGVQLESGIDSPPLLKKVRVSPRAQSQSALRGSWP
jgi:hypothetical protein